MKMTIVAIGKTRGVEFEWCAEYQKRLGPCVAIQEYAASKSLPPTEMQKAEAQLILKALPAKSFIVLLDEHGIDLTSRDLANKISAWQDQGISELVFVIGGADGVTQDIKNKADIKLSFGRLTWPHRLVRVMVLEQIYRAKQIIAGHPYHRD